MTTPPATPRGNPTLVLFLTIFTAMLGLSVLFPVIGPLGRQLGFTPTQIGWFSTAYSLAQLLFSTFWGRRSERLGRKPVLVTGLLGFSLSFALFGLLALLGLKGVLGGTLLFVLLVAARFIGGVLSSATLPTAQAMMADLSSTENRAAAMGLVGAAFGLGVVFGPALGGLLAGLGLTAPLLFSAGLGLLIAALAQATLHETRQPDAQPMARDGARTLLANRTILLFLTVSALFTLASVGMEQTIAFDVQDTLHLDPQATARTVGGMLAVFGVLSAVVQGGAIRPLSRRFTPPVLIAGGLVVMATGLLLIPLAHGFWSITGALAVTGIGSAVLSPTLSATLSLIVGEGEQGAVAGLNSSALALGRMTGPLLGTALYQNVGHAAPYLLSAGVLGLLPIGLWLTRPQVKNTLHSM